MENFHPGEVSSKGLLRLPSHLELWGRGAGWNKDRSLGDSRALPCEIARMRQQAQAGTREFKGVEDPKRKPAEGSAVKTENTQLLFDPVIPLRGIYPQTYLHM